MRLAALVTLAFMLSTGAVYALIFATMLYGAIGVERAVEEALRNLRSR